VSVKTVEAVVDVLLSSVPDPEPVWACATPAKPNRMAKAAAASPAPDAEINLRTYVLRSR
jgi:hypothetical protein